MWHGEIIKPFLANEISGSTARFGPPRFQERLPRATIQGGHFLNYKADRENERRREGLAP